MGDEKDPQNPCPRISIFKARDSKELIEINVISQIQDKKLFDLENMFIDNVKVNFSIHGHLKVNNEYKHYLVEVCQAVLIKNFQVLIVLFVFSPSEASCELS